MSPRTEANLHWISRLIISALLGITVYFLTRTINQLDTVTSNLQEVTHQQLIIITEMKTIQRDVNDNRVRIREMEQDRN